LIGGFFLKTKNIEAKLILENGMEFKGKAFGYIDDTVGEVVFNTSMTGYQETLTDPSYYGQIVTMTYPLIGNYGINLEDLESMYMSFDLLFNVNDMAIENPMNFKIVDNKVYVSKNSLLEVITLARILESDSEAKVMQEVYDNDLSDVDYILLTDLGDVYKDMSYKEMSDNGYT